MEQFRDYFFISEETSVYKSEYHTGYSDHSDNTAQVPFLDFVNYKACYRKHKALTYVTEHYTEEQYIRYGKYACRINFRITRKSIHFNEHFKRFKYRIIFQLCRRLNILDVLCVLHIEHHNVIRTVNLFFKRLCTLFIHPTYYIEEHIAVNGISSYFGELMTFLRKIVNSAKFIRTA